MSMVRGVRGAITVSHNDEGEMVQATKSLLDEMIKHNDISAEEVAQVIISVTEDLNATFPAKALRLLEDWTYVPVMCTQEISVPNSLPKCIRVMMTINTEKSQKDIEHIYMEDAVALRPDLLNQKS